MSQNESWYDAEVAPALLALAERCAARGMNFHATVEYEPGHRGSTTLYPAPSLAMTMLLFCSRAAENIDGYFINLARHCRQHEIDTSQSFVMQRFVPSATQASGEVAK